MKPKVRFKVGDLVIRTFKNPPFYLLITGVQSNPEAYHFYSFTTHSKGFGILRVATRVVQSL